MQREQYRLARKGDTKTGPDARHLNLPLRSQFFRRLCVGMGGIWDQDVPRRGREPFALPSCQIDHEPTDFVRVEVLAEKA